MNILITSAGRRGYIIKWFKEVIREGGKVHVCNSSPVSAAMQYGDESVVSPLIYDENYIPFLIDYCKNNDISAIIPLFDIDVLMLARNKERLQSNGIMALVSDERVAFICNDKYKTYEFCRDNGINTVPTYIRKADINGEYPYIIKPRWGMGSIGIHKVYNQNELEVISDMCLREIKNSYLKYESSYDENNSLIYQNMMQGQEYGLDIINDLDGNYQTYILRKKLAMRSGETDTAVVVKDSRFDEFAKRISKSLDHIGNLDVDAFLIGDEPYLLEMNARFGGGYPFSHLAGVNLPKAYIKWLSKETITDELQVKEYNRVVQKDISFIYLK